MANTKTYESINSINMIWEAKVNGKYIPIVFTGGTNSPKRENAKFTTDNESIQEALEKSPYFNREYKLINVEEVVVPVQIPEQIQIKQIEGIFNGQQAKEYIIKNFPGTTFRVLQNKQMILQFAKEHHIEFTDWPID